MPRVQGDSQEALWIFRPRVPIDSRNLFSLALHTTAQHESRKRLHPLQVETMLKKREIFTTMCCYKDRQPHMRRKQRSQGEKHLDVSYRI